MQTLLPNAVRSGRASPSNASSLAVHCHVLRRFVESPLRVLLNLPSGRSYPVKTWIVEQFQIPSFKLALVLAQAIADSQQVQVPVCVQRGSGSDWEIVRVVEPGKP